MGLQSTDDLHRAQAGLTPQIRIFGMSDVKRNTPVERESWETRPPGMRAAFAPLLGLFMEGLSSYHS